MLQLIFLAIIISGVSYDGITLYEDTTSVLIDLGNIESNTEATFLIPYDYLISDDFWFILIDGEEFDYIGQDQGDSYKIIVDIPAGANDIEIIGTEIPIPEPEPRPTPEPEPEPEVPETPEVPESEQDYMLILIVGGIVGGIVGAILTALGLWKTRND